MTTECNQFVFGFHPQKRREIRAQFDGRAITSDGGGLLLREVEKRIGILRQFAACFTDYRNPELLEHPVEEMVAQRVYGLALGYEDLNDHEELRNDPLLAVLVEKGELGKEALAGKSTLNRLELTGVLGCSPNPEILCGSTSGEYGCASLKSLRRRASRCPFSSSVSRNE